MCRTMSVFQVVKDVASTITLGIGLPSSDVGTDINLGVRLIQNGHPRWAMWVLAPVFANIFFTLFACRRIEGRSWLCYTPLIVLQFYPQFCVARLLFRWARHKIKREQFLKERDDLDGGLGCIESYLESVPQVFIQTAFFTIANSLTATTERLCYNEKDKTCQRYDNCSTLKKCSDTGYDFNLCNPIGYDPYHYKSDAEIQNCVLKTQNCTIMFEACIQPLNECLSNCALNLTSQIEKINERDLFNNYLAEPRNYTSHFLHQDYDASKGDLINIQLYLLFIGDKYVFLSTYCISIFAAAYGITKFFRLSYSRHCNDGDEYKLNVKTFCVTFLITCISLVSRGAALAAFMLMNTNSMLENVLWWTLFCILPSFLFSFFMMFGRTCEKRQTNRLFGCNMWNNHSLTILLKVPPAIWASVVTPFMYSPVQKGVTGFLKEFHDKHDVCVESKRLWFKLDYNLTFINNCISVFFVVIGLIVNIQLKMEAVLLYSTLFLMITTLLIFAVKKLDDGGSKKCFKHWESKLKCEECMMEYGVQIWGQRKEVCSPMKNDAQCEHCGEFKTQITIRMAEYKYSVR